jgi:hypothetical protein
MAVQAVAPFAIRLAPVFLVDPLLLRLQTISSNQRHHNLCLERKVQGQGDRCLYLDRQCQYLHRKVHRLCLNSQLRLNREGYLYRRSSQHWQHSVNIMMFILKYLSDLAK